MKKNISPLNILSLLYVFIFLQEGACGSPAKDYYQILEVERDAKKEEIKKSYRKKSILYHPDKWHEGSGFSREEGEQKFKDAAEAYETLYDDGKRSRYNKLLNNFYAFRGKKYSFKSGPKKEDFWFWQDDHYVQIIDKKGNVRFTKLNDQDFHVSDYPFSLDVKVVRKLDDSKQPTRLQMKERAKEEVPDNKTFKVSIIGKNQSDFMIFGKAVQEGKFGSPSESVFAYNPNRHLFGNIGVVGFKGFGTVKAGFGKIISGGKVFDTRIYDRNGKLTYYEVDFIHGTSAARDIIYHYIKSALLVDDVSILIASDARRLDYYQRFNELFIQVGNNDPVSMNMILKNYQKKKNGFWKGVWRFFKEEYEFDEIVIKNLVFDQCKSGLLYEGNSIKNLLGPK